EAGLCVGQRPQLVQGVEIRARQCVRLALVQVGTQADVPVGEREHRLGLREPVEVERRLADGPRLDGEARIRAHPVTSSSERWATTTRAPCASSARACPTRSTPTTSANPPAAAAATPASASSNTAPASGGVPSLRAAARNMSGAGLP